jgi:serine/threonine protein kinase
LTKLLDFGLTGVVYLAQLGSTAIAAKQALQEAVNEIMHEADIYLLLNNSKLSGQGVPVYFGTFVRDDVTFMLTSYCGNSFGTWKQMWLLQLYVNSSLVKILLTWLSSIHTRHILLQLHRLGLCHGDVHPGNIVRDWCGRVSIVDFASARTLSDGECECYQQLDKIIHSRLREMIPYLFFTLALSGSLLAFL